MATPSDSLEQRVAQLIQGRMAGWPYTPIAPVDTPFDPENRNHMIRRDGVSAHYTHSEVYGQGATQGSPAINGAGFVEFALTGSTPGIQRTMGWRSGDYVVSRVDRPISAVFGIYCPLREDAPYYLRNITGEIISRYRAWFGVDPGGEFYVRNDPDRLPSGSGSVGYVSGATSGVGGPSPPTPASSGVKGSMRYTIVTIPFIIDSTAEKVTALQ